MAVGSVVAVALLLLVLAAWAASIGPSDVVNGPGPSPASSPPPTTASPSALEPPTTTPPAPTHHGTPGWLRLLALVVDVAVAVLVALLLVRYVGKPLAVGALRWRRRRRAGPRDEPDLEVLEPARLVAEQLLADAPAQREELLLGDTPRNAVVACWHRFERQGEAAGVARRSWETSSEYTMRVLDLVDAHQPAVSVLGSLYREARFSEHELTEEHRQQALAALDTIHRTTGVGT